MTEVDQDGNCPECKEPVNNADMEGHFCAYGLYEIEED